MRRVHSQTIPTRSAFPATRRNSLPQTLFRRAAIWREFPAPASLCPCRSRRESTPSNPSAPRGPRFQTRAAFPPIAQSSRQTGLRLPVAAAANRFPVPAKPVSINLPPAAAIHPVQILLPDSPPLPTATPRQRSSPRPARTRSALAHGFPGREAISGTIARPARAAPHRAAPNPASQSATFRVPPLRSRLPLCGI